MPPYFFTMPDSDRLLDYEINEKGESVAVRSLRTDIKVYLRFTNKTKRTVEVWWRDFRGYRQFYAQIKPSEYCHITSYVDHPWQFTDDVTRERYVVNNKVTFTAPPSIGGMLFRTNWNITIGVRSLQATALLEIAQKMQTPEDVDTLDLPSVLANDVKELVTILHTRPRARIS